MKKLQALLLASVWTMVSASAADALWMRDVKISPDGTQIAFAYKGDIYTVGADGGQARRLTSLPSYEEKPVWSPDGKQIAFASNRHGNADIYIMSADGGKATRLTSNSAAERPEAFTPDSKEVLYSAAIQNPATSAMFPSSRMTELYAVEAKNGGKVRQVLGTPAQALAFTPDGKMLYQDVKGFEDEWRKHHTSSESRDIWVYNPAQGTHINITNRPGEDRNPVVSADGSTVYILSERNGDSFNLWSFPLDNPAQARKLTNFKTHPVRFLSGDKAGKLAFTYDGEIYTLDTKGGKPQKIEVDVVGDDDPLLTKTGVGLGGAQVSPDGKMMAFTSRGDVFVTSVEYPTTVQVTHTPAAEGQICWGSDNRTLYYTSERSGHKNIYQAKMAREDDPNFANATAVEETPMFDVKQPARITDPVDEYSHPVISPDGKQMAFVKNRNNLMVMDLESKKVRSLTKGETYPGQSDGMTFVWSPDSRWLAIELIPEMRDPYSDIALVNVETGEITNITNSGYFCTGPRFVLDGNALIYFTDRYGMFAQASWGSQDDVMIVFLNRDARDRFNLSEEDYALLKDAEKKRKDEGAKKDDDSKSEKESKKNKKAKNDDNDKDADADKKDADKKDEVKPIVVEFDDIDSRIMRLTPYSSGMSDAIVTGDGETLYYTCKFEDGYDLWKMPLRKREPRLVSKLNSGGGIGFQMSKDGKTIFLTGGRVQKLEPGSDKLTNISVSASHQIDHAAEREAMFNYVTVEEAARFYNKNMHGVDWPAMTAAYRKFLPHINNNEDFAELLSEMLGELNVSHTGGRYYGNAINNPDETASLGLIYDMDYDGEGMRVAEVIVNGPSDRSSSKLGKGAVITAINGVKLGKGVAAADSVMNNMARKKTLVEFTTADGEKVAETILPVTRGRINSLLYDRWVKQREADVARMSNGRLGYVHIASMDDASYRPMYDALMGKYNNCEGVVIDIRWNGGGRMHEDIETLFTGEKYLTQEIRGKDVCDMPSRRWNKPSVMLVAEPCYSNAHGTPWVYKHQKIGKVVGMPVPGTMTSVNWVTMQDPSMVFGIPVIGYRTAEGEYLENSQLEPDVKVANDPAVIVKGEDTQLRTAVETLLQQIDARKK